MNTETEWATISHDDGTVAGHIPVHIAEGLGVEFRGRPRISNDQIKLFKAHPAWKPAIRPLPTEERE